MNDLIKGFKDTLSQGMDKIASEYQIDPSNYDEFLVKVAEEFETSVKANGLDKEALFGKAFSAGAAAAAKIPHGLSLSSKLGYGLGTAAIGVGATLGANAIQGLASMAVNKVGNMFGASSNRSAYEHSLAQAIAGSEILTNADPMKVKRMADSIFMFAPTVAADSNVLTNILVNAIHGDSIDLQTVRAVTELEEKLSKINR